MKTIIFYVLAIWIGLSSQSLYAQTDLKQDSLFSKIFAEVNADLTVPQGYRVLTEEEWFEKYNGRFTYPSAIYSMVWEDVYIGGTAYLVQANKSKSHLIVLEEMNLGLTKCDRMFPWDSTKTVLQIKDNVYKKKNNIDSLIIRNGTHTFELNGITYNTIYVKYIKFDLGAVLLHYTFPIAQQKKVIKEIKKNWGMVKFRPDTAFQKPKGKYYVDVVYFGKFSYANDQL